jgi:hypothetical protein
MKKEEKRELDPDGDRIAIDENVGSTRGVGTLVKP